MARWKRLFYYLMINVLVSACTILAVLAFWERTHPFADSRGSSVSSLPSPTLPVLATFFADTVEPTLTATRALTTYQVQAGDTLGEIALQFGVTVDEIMQLNGLDDANSLAVGMELFIPVVENILAEEPSRTELPVNTEIASLEGATGTPGTPAVEAQVVIVNVFGAGDLPTERVRLERRGEGDLNMAGWQLMDEDNHIYPFPQLTLFPGGAVDLYTRTGNDDVVELYWGLENPVWEPGEIATLLDDRGIVRATFTVP